MAKNEEPTGYEILWEKVNKLKCYKTLQNQHLIAVDINNRFVLINVNSEDFKNWAIHTLSLQGKTIAPEGLKHIVNRLNAKIWSMDTQIEVYSRIARNNSAIYYDLCNKNGEIVKITKKGYFISRSEKCSLKFVRSGNMKEQYKPLESSDIDIFKLAEYFNVKSKESLSLMLIYIISCFIPNIAHPILILVGSQGASKTTSNILIKRIVDPAYADVISLPKEKRDLIVQLNREYVLFFDNIKKISNEFNDVFCQASTGGYQIARKLYTDDEIVAYKLQRCILLNGITELTNQPDLLDRAISIRFERIDEGKRLTEAALYTSFNNDLPYILNSIFNIVSKAMKIHERVKLQKLPRMADFATWGYAIAEAMRIGGDNFLKYYRANRLGIGLELLQSNATAMGIIDYMKQKEHWKGSVKSFWEELDRFAIRKKINQSDPTWAKNANSLGKRMEEIKVNLEEQGVHFDKRNVGTHKELDISYKKPERE